MERNSNMVKDTKKGKKSFYRRIHGFRLTIIFLSLLFFQICPVAYGESASAKDPLIEHLEFLGYECDVVEAGIRARHLSKIHLYISYAFGGIRIQTGFPGTSPHSDVGSRYLVTNALIKRFSVGQIYWSDKGNLFVIAWMPGKYEKTRFALFMEAWDHDADVLRGAYKQLKPFLKEPLKGSEKKAS